MARYGRPSVRVLLPLPDHDFDVTEVAVPWKLLTEAGHEVVFATERAGVVPEADPRLLTGVLFGRLGAADEPKAFYRALTKAPAFRDTVGWIDLDVDDFDGLVLPGGHAPRMRQYLGSAVLQHRVAEFWALDRPVGAICHGVLVLARAKAQDGRSLLSACRTTCLTKPLERTAYYLTGWRLGRYYRTYPTYVEDEVRAALDGPNQFERGPFVGTKRGTRTDHGPAFVVEDGRYVSARWPGDAYLFAERFIERIEGRARP
jgi:putative intracellular protease/amidase